MQGSDLAKAYAEAILIMLIGAFVVGGVAGALVMWVML